MRLVHEILTLHTRHPFVIARGGSSEWRTVLVRVVDESDGAEGWGEAAGNRFYGENLDTVVAVLPRLEAALEGVDPWAIERAEAEMNRAIRGHPAAKSAVSAALHDLAAKRLGVPLYRMWGLEPRTVPLSSYTIAIAGNDELRRRVDEAREYPVLKVKLGTDRDAEIIRVVRDAAPDKRLRVDANAAWTAKHALRMIELLRELDVEFVEQPLPPHDLEGLRFVRERSVLPIVADESCLVASDVAKLAGVVDGINIKLAKCGGLREALRMIATARAHGMLVMAGCMIESSLGITAAAHLAPLLDFADLDGAALLRDDPFVGATIHGGRIELPTGAGLGVTRR
jgi:L-alanine-DL-glutamate epimerase-like enolase superfamily enzyme